MGDRDRLRGFSLVEVLAAVAILGMILAVTLPNLRSMQVKARLNGAVRDVERLTSTARYQAVNASRQAVVHFLRANGTYAEYGARPFVGKYAAVVFLDQDGNGVFGGSDRITDTYVLPRTVAFRRPGSATPLPVERLTYRASGEITAAANVEVYFGDEIGNFMRLVVMPTGHTRRQKHVLDTADDWWGTDREGQWKWRY